MKSRSGLLLGRVVESGEISREEMARELHLAPREIDAFIEGSQVMSLAHQLCLAALVVERVPRFARQGHTLRAQVAAAMAFQEGRTEVHSQARTTWRTLRPSGDWKGRSR